MNIKELCQETGFVERQVRYLIAEGFMPAPRGGRANAEYGEDHVAAITRYQRLRDLGFPPAAIKVLLQSKEGAPFPIADGITLVVHPHLFGSGKPVTPLIQELQKVLKQILKEKRHAADVYTADE